MPFETRTKRSCSVNSSQSSIRSIQTSWNQTLIRSQALQRKLIIRITRPRVAVTKNQCTQLWEIPLQKQLRKNLKWFNRKVMALLLPILTKCMPWSVSQRRRGRWDSTQQTSAFKSRKCAQMKAMMSCWRTYWRYLTLSSSNHRFPCWALKNNIESIMLLKIKKQRTLLELTAAINSSM